MSYFLILPHKISCPIVSSSPPVIISVFSVSLFHTSPGIDPGSLSCNRPCSEIRSIHQPLLHSLLFLIWK